MLKLFLFIFLFSFVYSVDYPPSSCVPRSGNYWFVIEEDYQLNAIERLLDSPAPVDDIRCETWKYKTTTYKLNHSNSTYDYYDYIFKEYGQASIPDCTDGKEFFPKFGTCLTPCDYGKVRDDNGVCSCELPYQEKPSDGTCGMPPICELDNQVPDDNWVCDCDDNSTRSPFTGKCIKRCGQETDDIDCDGIPNGDDDDIDGDGIPNDDDPDRDGDGIPNGDDDTPDGGSGGGGDPKDPIDDPCILEDLNSHTFNGVCICNANYHRDIDNTCVVDKPIKHDPSCDYPAIKNSYPFQDTTFTKSGCEYFINYWNGGTYDKLVTCDYWGCYFNKSGGGIDGNETDDPPGDDPFGGGDGVGDGNGDGVGDGNDGNGSSITDFGLFDKITSGMNDAQGQTIDLNVKGGSGQPITFSIMGKHYVLFDPAMIKPEVWATIQIVIKWIAIISAIFTLFMTI